MGGITLAYGDFAEIYDELIYEDINYDSMCARVIDICNEEKITFNINYMFIWNIY